MENGNEPENYIELTDSAKRLFRNYENARGTIVGWEKNYTVAKIKWNIYKKVNAFGVLYLKSPAKSQLSLSEGKKGEKG